MDLCNITPSLTSLTLDNISKVDINSLMFEWKEIGKISDIEELMKRCIGLEELKLPSGILWDKSVSWLLSQIGSTEKAPAALRVLDLTMQSNANDGMTLEVSTRL